MISEQNVGMVFRLSMMSQKFPELSKAEREARLSLAGTIAAWDESENPSEGIHVAGWHNVLEQLAVNHALTDYGNALANLLRGEE